MHSRLNPHALRAGARLSPGLEAPWSLGLVGRLSWEEGTMRLDGAVPGGFPSLENSCLSQAEGAGEACPTALSVVAGSGMEELALSSSPSTPTQGLTDRRAENKSASSVHSALGLGHPGGTHPEHRTGIGRLKSRPCHLQAGPSQLPCAHAPPFMEAEEGCLQGLWGRDQEREALSRCQGTFHGQRAGSQRAP